MQTFLPLENYTESARVLDYRRLGKQRIECKQILQTLLGRSRGWANHPAVRMWEGYEDSLIRYAICICSEWRLRGYRDNQLDWFVHLFKKSSVIVPIPPWLGDHRFHSSHRAALLFKAPEHYSQFGWTEEPKIDYYWPTAEV